MFRVLWLLPAFAACDPSTTGDDVAAIAILSPEDGDRVCGTPLVVDLEIHGITLVDPYNPPDPPLADSGHVDLMLNGQDALMSDQRHVEVPDVAEGEWQLKVELSKADHTPLDPYAGDFLYITVADDACAP